jgi:hypothetical protein
MSCQAYIDPGLLEFRDQCRIVFLASGVGLKQDLLLSSRIHRFLGFIGEASAIGGLVMDDSDALVGEVFREVSGGNLPLPIVPAANTVNVGTGTVIQLRTGW